MKPTEQNANTAASGESMNRQLANLNLALALERVSGDRELLREIARIFLETAPEMMAEIRTALEHNDALALQHAAHSLKGSVGNFGAEAVWQAAYRVESIGRNGDLTGAREAVEALERTLASIEPELVALGDESQPF